MKPNRQLLLFWGLFLTVHFSVFAQSKFQIGIVAGINQSWDLDRDNNNLINIPGYHIGLNTRISLSKNIHFQPEIALVNRITGYNTSNNTGGVKTQSKIRSSTTMLQIPVTVQFGRKTYFGFGFAYGFPFRSHTSGTGTVTANGTATKQDFSNAANMEDIWPYKPLDLGICFGNRTKKLGWEIRPTISTTVSPNFWVLQEDIEGAVFHITGVIIWKIK